MVQKLGQGRGDLKDIKWWNFKPKMPDKLNKLLDKPLYDHWCWMNFVASFATFLATYYQWFHQTIKSKWWPVAKGPKFQRWDPFWCVLFQIFLQSIFIREISSKNICYCLVKSYQMSILGLNVFRKALKMAFFKQKWLFQNKNTQ